MDYMEIAKRLRNYEWERDDDGKCLGCPDEESYYPCCVDCFSRTHLQAADAIEELQGQIDGWIEQERNALLKSVPKWIPVTERLPKDIDEEVLVCTEDYGVSDLGFVTVATYGVSGWLECWERKTYLTAVTHWMPLPEPPKEE
jgi:hypothetical protein